MINICLLGSTGSIGTQVLDVARRLPDRIHITALSAMYNGERLLEQIREFGPEYASIGTEKGFEELKDRAPAGTELLWGPDSMIHMATLPQISKTVVSVAGFPGFAPTMAALKAGKTVCLASKEVLVAGGHLVSRLAKRMQSPIVPIDSEHSAVFQCLQGERRESVRRIIITASGGAFRDRTTEEMRHVTPAQALDHPTWKMGKKVTVDCATLMNKGLEVIEAKWLFDLEPEQVSVVQHRESIVHSMVEYHDSAVIAQLGAPDMRVPIQYALLYPDRAASGLPGLDLVKAGALHFEEPDTVRFPALELARSALKAGGSVPCVMSAADKAAVDLFLDGKIGFLDIVPLVEREMERTPFVPDPSLEEIIAINDEVEQRVLREHGSG
ncbi:MAG: 1-deoxy-D-xylulose-5-phosphate reductoisomerase [Abditibacteriota bacterium]|nr:1-deoxy-D-xylulose-5-phosphate reductoisomerase [Abditibacteriota bacterium]